MNYGFHRAAIGEHLDQVAFYASQFAGLGADYLGEFDALVAPPDIHKVALKGFPFM